MTKHGRPQLRWKDQRALQEDETDLIHEDGDYGDYKPGMKSMLHIESGISLRISWVAS
jgi:hypothetical protein